jgi:DNA polymerase-2
MPGKMVEIRGWLLDLYAHPEDRLVLWVLGEDGQRHRLRQDFPVTFYAAGETAQLRALWRWLRNQPIPVQLSRQEGRDLFQEDPLPVLAATVLQPDQQPRLFQKVSRAFPRLTYYDADIPLPVRHAALYGSFPLCRLGVRADPESVIQSMKVDDSPWELDAQLPALRILKIQPDVDPNHGTPTHLQIQAGPRRQYRIPLQPTRPFLVSLSAILRRHDPDLLLTLYGDAWLLPHLLEQSQAANIPLPLNRDAGMGVTRRAERTYYAYGQVIYRGPKVMLFGRWHIDAANTVMFDDYDLDGVLEMARVTSLSAQTAARVSPGTGISAMQIRTALERGTLVPWHKQQAERPKTALQLMHADKGGMVYQPLVGLHRDVAEIDFVSMYPSVMVHFNISPETVGEKLPGTHLVPDLGLHIDREKPGLVSETLRPLLEKRIALKTALLEMPTYDPRRKRYQAYASAHKWLLVTCFGYLGYKNARFGRIEAHEAVTAYGREALLRAKEAAEDLGFTVLHMYVDGLWVRKDEASQVRDFQPLVDEILARTGLPISLDGIYKWVAFLPSRTDARVPVANRYFGAFYSSKLKLRGIEARRHDTPSLIKQIQIEIIERLSEAPAQNLESILPWVTRMLQHRLIQIRQGRIPLQDLLITQKLSREVEAYRVPSPVARAVSQLAREGKSTRPGQYVRFIYIYGNPGVHAWDLSVPLNPAAVDVKRYRTLLIRAAHTVLQPLGVSEQDLELWLHEDTGYGTRQGDYLGQPFSYAVSDFAFGE